MQKEKMPIRINQHLVKRAAAVISCYSYKNLNVVKELILFMQFYEKKKKNGYSILDQSPSINNILVLNHIFRK